MFASERLSTTEGRRREHRADRVLAERAETVSTPSQRERVKFDGAGDERA
jgi:hypothetical protein